MEGNLAATYALIYHFLKQQSQNKAAEAVKKAAKAVVVLRDDLKQEGPTLEDVIREWKGKQNTKSIRNRDAEPSPEESGSSDDSSSDSEDDSDADSSPEKSPDSESEDDTSDSDDSSDESDDGIKKSLQKPVEHDTSVTLSSAGENTREATKPIASKSAKHKDASSDDSSSDSSAENSTSDSSDAESSSDSSGCSDKKDATISQMNSSNKTKTTKGVISSTDSESESESESDDESESEPPKKKDIHVAKKSETSESSSESEEELAEPQQKEDGPVAKKRKTSDTGTAVTTAVATESRRTEKLRGAAKERFQRVKVQNFAPELLLNNGYTAKGGATNDYGERAHRDLIVTRGAGFRKEKNKKKRGSYRGGEITMENHSIKFDF